MERFILSTLDYHLLFFHRYQLYIAFYYSYVISLAINPCGHGPVSSLILFWLLNKKMSTPLT